MSRALIISNQYNQFPSARLYGCYNDANNFIIRIRNIYPNIRIVHMKDNYRTTDPLYPTKKNILREMINLFKSPENKLFFYYSGHGCYYPDYNNDEKTINFNSIGRQITSIESVLQDSCIVTNDIKYCDIILDDEISGLLPLLRSTQTLYAFMDSCNSGTGFDLCYVNLGTYNNDFKNNSIPLLQNEIKTNCSMLSSNYPDKINSVNGNVILFSGTRDKDYSYEGYSNGTTFGYFTNSLCWLLDYGIENMSIKDFYYYLIAIINIQMPSSVLKNFNLPAQIPVITTSRNINLDTIKMIDFKYSATIKNKNINQLIPKLKNYNINNEKIIKNKQLVLHYMNKK